MNVEWETTWSYRDAETDGVNNAVVFQTLAMGALFLVWVAVSFISINPKPRSETKKLRVILKDGCKAAAFQEGILSHHGYLMRPRVIVTRTNAAIFITFCLAQLLIFNMIANYVRGVNASLSLILTLFTFLLMFMRVTFKHQKIEEVDHLGNKSYFMNSGIIFIMIVGTWFMLGSYSDIFATKHTDGSDIMFGIGGALISLGLVCMFIVPFFLSTPKKVRKTNTTQTGLSLALSGEFYTAFNLVDCIVVSTCFFIFVLLTVIFISRATTRAYGVAFWVLYPIPVYGFASNLMHLAYSEQSFRSRGPQLFNMFLFSVFLICLILSQAHVCGIPGVKDGCVKDLNLEHKSEITNWGLCFPILLFLLMITMGIIQAPYAPSLLVNQECIDKNEDFDQYEEYAEEGPF